MAGCARHNGSWFKFCMNGQVNCLSEKSLMKQGDDIAREEQPGENNTEVGEYLDIRQQRRWIFPRAALVGFLAGVVSLLFRIALTTADRLRIDVITWAQSVPFLGWLFPVLLTAVGATLAVALTRRYAPEAAGSGIPHLEAVLQHLRKLDWKRVLPVKFIGGTLAIGSGLALGREGPSVQMGGAVADAVARLLKVSKRERLTLISAGAGAGLAAAFNAPLAGLVFVLEEVRRDFQPIVFGAAFVASVTADIVARVGAGQFPVFSVPAYPVPPLQALPFFAILGILAGGLGVLFNRTLLLSGKWFANIPGRFALVAAGVVGGLLGLVSWFSPTLIGSGHVLAEEALHGDLVLTVLPALFFLRLVFTSASYGTGAPGGIFAPLLALGALLGLMVGQLAQMAAPQVVTLPAVFAVVGMAAFFTAVVRAPLTGIMLIIEMTGNYSQMLPLLASCFCAYAVAELLRDLPIYEALLQRDLRQNGVHEPLAEPAVVSYIIQRGAPFSGLLVKQLGLPAGCILVRCSDGKHEWVPRAHTRLEAHMHITAIVAPDAPNGLEVLHRGCSGDEVSR